ncbi:MAG: TIGR03118 family protein [Steroidobacteraceae bacterium]
MTSLVANANGTAALTVDSNLLNPWGLSMAPGDPVWVANNGTQTSTLYDGNGKVQSASGTTLVKLPAGAGNVPFAPTGIVANTTADFVVSAGGSAGAALFIYSGKSGMLAGWAPTVDVDSAVTAYAATDGAVYTGLAIASNGGSNFLYAADFLNNRIDVFNATYQKQTTSATSFSFTDSTLPAGYAPFGIQAVNNGSGGATQIYVAYAQQGSGSGADLQNAFGAGLGLVDVFDTNGKLLSHLIPVGGALNAPWGIALAPSDFAPLSNDLLIGNFGDGKINAYNPTTGAFVAALSDSAGNPLAIPGLWGIVFGNDSDNQPHNTLFYAAGPDNQTDGGYGRIDVGATPPMLNKAPVITITAPPPSSGGGYGGGGTTISGTVAVTATATDSVAIASVQFFANGASIGTVTASPYTVQWNTKTVANGSVALTAKATDVDGNVGTSAAVNVVVSN